MPRKPALGKSLAELNPELAKEWHLTKNGDLTASDVSEHSGLKVWWKCDKGADHEWIALVANRSNGRGCPICAGYKIVHSNCLFTLNPDLAKEWHPTKNELLTPRQVGLGSNKKVWWKCDKGNDHEWISSINDRSKNGCPICSGKKIVHSNCLFTLNPDLAKEWHLTKNELLTPRQVGLYSHKKVWWKCDKGNDHEWQSSISHRSNGRGCPICNGNKVVHSNCLFTLNPDLAKEWHPTKNELLTPRQVGLGSNKKVWWKCDKGNDHEWISSIKHRSRNGCPICSGFKVVKSNSLFHRYPKIARELHPTKNNGINVKNLYYSSYNNVWWKCDKGDDHEWKTTVRHRTRSKSNCPYCTLTPQSKQELTITFELIQFFKIDPKGFKTKVNGKLWTIDIFISELKLGIEFDGSYWHKDKRALDKLKTKKLEDDGFTIMRIREEPLKLITDIDIISKIPFNAKQVTNDILVHIIDAYKIDVRKRIKIKNYLLKESIQNEKGLNDYIDMILTKKANKKNK